MKPLIHVPQPRDIYIIQRNLHTKAGVSYSRGDKLILIEMTEEAPFKSISQLGNWKVHCKHFAPPDKESIWSNIWLFIEKKTIAWEGSRGNTVPDDRASLPMARVINR